MAIDLTREVGSWGYELGIEEGPRYDDLSFQNVICKRITFIPHTHCTHAESIEHLKGSKGRTTWELLNRLPYKMSARLWRDKPAEACDMLIIKKEDINKTLFDNMGELRVLATNAVSLDQGDDPDVPLHRMLFAKLPDCILIELLSDTIYELNEACLYSATIIGIPFASDAIPTALAYCRIWHHFDISVAPLGRIASQIATILQGKHKPIWHPAADCGDYVVVTNASRCFLTGSKGHEKLYRWHTGYRGGLKERDIVKAVRGMLPKNRLRDLRISRLKVFPGSKHPYKANMFRDYLQ